MTSLSSELENLKKKKLENFQVFFDNRVDGRPGNFSYCKIGNFEGGKTNKHNFFQTHRIINNRQFNKVPQTFQPFQLSYVLGQKIKKKKKEIRSRFAETNIKPGPNGGKITL